MRLARHDLRHLLAFTILNGAAVITAFAPHKTEGVRSGASHGFQHLPGATVWNNFFPFPHQTYSSCIRSIEQSDAVAAEASPSRLSHSDITWKIHPEESASFLRKLQWSVAGKLLRLQCRLQDLQPPRLLFPISGQAVVFAYHGRKKIGRFGIVTEAGPIAPQLIDTVKSVYNIPDCVLARASAVIYMFVEPEYRGRSVGALALETIGYLHAARGCDYTLLVANDKSDHQSLVQWYESHGYARAPALQEVLGSPGGIYGTTMIAPTRQYVPDGCVIQWW